MSRRLDLDKKARNRTYVDATRRSVPPIETTAPGFIPVLPGQTIATGGRVNDIHAPPDTRMPRRLPEQGRRIRPSTHRPPQE
jgi:hypothetical protein